MYMITWKNLMGKCLTLAHLFLKGKVVWGPPRGGSIIASILHYHGCLLVPKESPEDIPFDCKFFRPLAKDDAPLITVVDDVADSGDTLRFYKDHGFKTAALFVRHSCHPKPDIYIQTIYVPDYILMPYENRVDVEKRLARKEDYKNGD